MHTHTKSPNWKSSDDGPSPEVKADFGIGDDPKKELPPVQIFRLRTTAYHTDKSGLVCTKTLRRILRQSKGFHWFEEDIANIGADEVVRNVTNLLTAPDGIYVLTPVNCSYDDGHLDDYDWKLVPLQD